MAFNYNKLRGAIREKYGTNGALARAIGISQTSLSLKLNNKSEFTQQEIVTVSSLLGISRKELNDYFFTLEVEKTKQNESSATR